ncbi:MAG: hypothetical protein WKF43_00900 [Acidimicrobiales bacterium]
MGRAAAGVDPALARPRRRLGCQRLRLLLAGGVVVGALVAGALGAWSELGAGRAVRSWASIIALAVAAALGLLYVVVVAPATSSPSVEAFWRPNYPSYQSADAFLFNGGVDHGVLPKFWDLTWRVFAQAFSGPTGVVLVVYAVALAALAWRRPLLAVLVATPVVLAIAGSFAQLSPWGGGRTEVYLYAPLVFTVVLSLDAMIDKGRLATSIGPAIASGIAAVGAVVLLVGSPAPRITSLPPVIDSKPLIERMEAEASPDDLVIVGASQVFVYPLYSRRAFTTAHDTSLPGSFRPVLAGANTVLAEFLVGALPRGRLTDTVWVIDSSVQRGGSSVQGILRADGYELRASHLAIGGPGALGSRLRSLNVGRGGRPQPQRDVRGDE